MTNLVSYDFIEHKVKVSNPFQFFYELKHHSVAHIIDQINQLVSLNNPVYLTDDVLEYAEPAHQFFDELIHKTDVDTDYMSDLDKALTVLKKSGYINCDHRTRFNENKHVLDMKITHLTLLEKGEKALHDLREIRKINSDEMIETCLEACSLYVEVSDIMSLSRDHLIRTFEAICLKVSSVPLISFNASHRTAGFFNYYQGYFCVYDFNRFNQFLTRNNLFELEKVMNNVTTEAIFAITEAKMILSYLEMGRFDQIGLFLEQDKLREHLNYLVNAEFLKIDCYFDESLHNNKPNITVHDFEITKAGFDYLHSSILKRVKNYHNNDSLNNALKALSHQKDYRKFINDTWLLKDIIVFHEEEL